MACCLHRSCVPPRPCSSDKSRLEYSRTDRYRMNTMKRREPFFADTKTNGRTMELRHPLKAHVRSEQAQWLAKIGSTRSRQILHSALWLGLRHASNISSSVGDRLSCRALLLPPVWRSAPWPLKSVDTVSRRERTDLDQLIGRTGSDARPLILMPPSKFCRLRLSSLVDVVWPMLDAIGPAHGYDLAAISTANCNDDRLRRQ